MTVAADAYDWEAAAPEVTSVVRHGRPDEGGRRPVRVSSTVERLDVSPGSSGVVPLEVINTSEVIESLSVRAIGLPEALVRSEPPALALFPEASGALTLTLDLPGRVPRGHLPADVVIAGSAPGATEAFHDLDLVVPPHPRLALTATPSRVRTRGRAAFTVEVRNEGNVPLDVALRAVDTDRTLRTSLTPSTLAVPAGAVATTTVLVRGPRQLLGSDRDRPLRVVAQATDTTADVELVLRQRSTFSRGLLTALVLLSILAAWALAFVLGMREVLGADPFAKVAPPSFFVNTATAEGTMPEGMPAGAMPKEGPGAGGHRRDGHRAGARRDRPAGRRTGHGRRRGGRAGTRPWRCRRRPRRPTAATRWRACSPVRTCSRWPPRATRRRGTSRGPPSVQRRRWTPSRSRSRPGWTWR